MNLTRIMQKKKIFSSERQKKKKKKKKKKLWLGQFGGLVGLGTTNQDIFMVGSTALRMHSYVAHSSLVVY